MMAVNRNRKMISTEKESAELDMSLASALKRIEYLIEKYGPDAELKNECDMYDEGEHRTLRVYIMEPESNAQMNNRIMYEEKYEIAREASDRVQYERLQKKFG